MCVMVIINHLASCKLTAPRTYSGLVGFLQLQKQGHVTQVTNQQASPFKLVGQSDYVA